jgi:diguanylate cyclase
MTPTLTRHRPMNAFSDPSPPRSARLSQRVYLPRVVGLALGGLCVGAAIAAPAQPAPWIWLLLLTHGLLWPHVAYVVASRSAKPRRTEKANLLIDSLLGGFWVVAMHGNLLPCVLIITMLSMNNVAIGGLRFFSRGALAQIIGAMLGTAIIGWHFEAESGVAVQIACLPFLIVYPLLIGMVTFRLAHQLNRQRGELRWLSESDALSGIYNRRFFEQRIAQEFENFKRHPAPTALVVADIDHFKNINDCYGHPVGDTAIRIAGQVFAEQARKADVAARIGGDEFAVLMPFTSASEARELVERLQASYAQATAGDVRLTGNTLSFGIAAAHPDMPSHQNWMELADRALYRAKARARGSVETAETEGIPA